MKDIQEENEYIDFSKLIGIIKSKITKIIIISTVVGILTFLISAFFIQPKYVSFIDIYVRNTTLNEAESDTVNANDITASQKLVTTYKVILQTNNVIEKLRAVTGIEYSNNEILEMIEFSSVENTEILRITASTNDPFLSAKICNGYAAIAPDVIREVIQGGSVMILSKAEPNGSPASPNIRLYTFIGFVLGFGLAALYYFLTDAIGNVIKSEEEFSNKFDYAVLGSVPDFFSLRELNIPNSVAAANKKVVWGSNETNKKLITEYTLLGSNSPFAVTEAYNLIRTNLIFSTSTTKNRIIVISSSLPNEFKSTASVNIAVSLCQLGAKVLLVDADMRRPTINRILHKENKTGLSRILAGLDDVENAVFNDVYMPGMDLLTSGPTPPNPAVLLASDRMEALINTIENEYDYVLVDTPPINVVTDALLLCKHTAGIVMIVREHKTKYNDVEKALKKIETMNGNLLGTIITNDESMKGDYGYNYGYGYAQPVTVE